MWKKGTSAGAEKTDYYALATITFVIICYLTVVFFKIKGFLLVSGDTAVAEQAIWNTIHGDWFYQSDLETSTNFREHLNFIQLLYLPFYWIYPSLLTLYAVINLTYGIAAFVLFRHVRTELGILAAAILTFCFLFNPIVVMTNVSAMHVVAIGAPLLLFTLISYEREKYWLWLLFLILLVSTSEFVAPTVFLLGIIALINRRPNKMDSPAYSFSALHVYLIRHLYNYRIW